MTFGIKLATQMRKNKTFKRKTMIKFQHGLNYFFSCQYYLKKTFEFKFKFGLISSNF